MEEVLDIDSRLRQSVRTLRAWHWMSRISENPDEIVELLTAEARDLIELGRSFPQHARQIGRLIVAYHAMIKQLREGEEVSEPESEEAA